MEHIKASSLALKIPDMTEVAAGRLQKAEKIKVLSRQDGKEMEGKGLLTNTLLLKVVRLNLYILTSIELPIETVGSH